MQETDDIELLQQYVRERSDEAFAALVARHVNLVYSAAWRKTGNPQAAEEVTQVVFTILAKKGAGLSKETILSGWLYQTARLTAAAFLRTENRRARREQEAYMQSLLNEPAPEAWQQMAPMLEDAMGRLGEKDRNAIILRFFEGKTMEEVGTAFGASENAAKKRVNRALGKLRKVFAKRGITSTTALIAGAISANSVQAAPIALAKSVTAGAIAKGVAANGSTLTLLRGALKARAWSKAKTAVVAGLGVLLAAVTTTITVKEIQRHHDYPWRVEGFDGKVLEQAPPLVAILPSKITFSAWGTMSDKKMGTGVSAQTVVQAAYGFWNDKRTILSVGLPEGRFDYIASLAQGNDEALQREVRRKFGVTAKREMRETDVLALHVRSSNAPGLKQGKGQGAGGSSSSGPGRYSVLNQPLSSVVAFLEDYFQVPIIDQTGLIGRFDVSLHWSQPDERQPGPEVFKKVLLDQLGLELVPSREPVEMLVVEKVK